MSWSRRRLRLEVPVAACTLALLVVSFVPWGADVLRPRRAGNAWHAATSAITVGVVLAGAVAWVMLRRPVARLVAATPVIVASAWLGGSVWAGPVGVADAGWTLYAPTDNAVEPLPGQRFGSYLGAVIAVLLAGLLVASVAVDAARDAEVRRTLPVTGIAALLAVSFAPWWRDLSHTATVWQSSDIWSAAVGVAAIALLAWYLSSAAAARVSALVAAILAVVAAVGFAVFGPRGAPPAGRRYVDYLPDPGTGIRRNVLYDIPVRSGPGFGEYLGLGLLSAVAAAMALALLAHQRRAARPAPA